MALPSRHRLPLGKKAGKSFSQRKTAYNSFFSVKYMEGGLKVSRAAIIVPARVISSAVVRNRTKRRISSIVSGLIEKTMTPIDIIITLRQKINKLSFNELQDSLEEIFKKAK